MKRMAEFDREEADRNFKTARAALEAERAKGKFDELTKQQFEDQLTRMKRQAELDREEADRKVRVAQEESERFKRQVELDREEADRKVRVAQEELERVKRQAELDKEEADRKFKRFKRQQQARDEPQRAEPEGITCVIG